MKNRKSIKMGMSFFFGMWMCFVTIQPAAAQFTVNINSDTSPTTFQQIQLMIHQLQADTSIAVDSKASKLQTGIEYVKTAERWIQTINFYSDQIVGDIKRFTSLKGILSMAESQLGLSDDTLKALRDVGELIRGAFTLKNNFLSLITTRLSMIESLENRARKGIFDPSADLQDLEEYLRYSIGREAGATLATREKMAEHDPLIERLTYELKNVRADRAVKEKQLSDINVQLGREGSLSSRPREAGVTEEGQGTATFSENRQSLSPEAVQTLTLRAGQLESQIADLVKQEQSLVDEIQKRYEEMQKNYDSAYLKGRYWNSVLQGWNDFDAVKKEQIENLIDNYGDAATSGQQ